MEATFGSFVKQKRTEKGISLRKFAELLNIAPGYMSDLEQGRRNAPSDKKIEKLEEILKLTELEVFFLNDLAAQTRENKLAPDITSYIASNDIVRAALRTAIRLQLSTFEWKKIIEQMNLMSNNK